MLFRNFPTNKPQATSYKLGFTLVELLIVMGVLSVLSILVILILNPAELLAKGRDTRRNSDIDNINRALDVYDSQGGDFSTTQANIVYISLPDSSSTCASYTNLPPLPPGPPTWSYRCATSANLRKTDGNGWIPLNFTQISGLSMPVLPIDPINTDTNQLYYTYIKGSWNLTAKMESRTLTQSLASTDSGTDPTRYEKGTDSKLWNQAQGLVAYWPFDEGAGTSAADLSGNGNNGTLNSGPTVGVSGKVGTAYRFTANGQLVSTPSIAPSGSSDHTIAFWVNITDLSAPSPNNKGIFMKDSTSGSYGMDISGTAPSLRYGIREGAGSSLSRTVLYNISGWSTADWHHLVGIYKVNDKVELYIDGVSVGSTAMGVFNVSAIPSSTVEMGSTGKVINSNPADPRFRGSIDEPRIYNRALSASEILAMYNATK